MLATVRPFLRMSGNGRSVTKRSGSTLIELLVVIALISLLITMLVPSLRRSMRLASATICQYNLSQINQSLTMYRLESAGWLPYVGTGDSAATGVIDVESLP